MLFVINFCTQTVVCLLNKKSFSNKMSCTNCLFPWNTYPDFCWLLMTPCFSLPSTDLERAVLANVTGWMGVMVNSEFGIITSTSMSQWIWLEPAKRVHSAVADMNSETWTLLSLVTRSERFYNTKKLWWMRQKLGL